MRSQSSSPKRAAQRKTPVATRRRAAPRVQTRRAQVSSKHTAPLSTSRRTITTQRVNGPATRMMPFSLVQSSTSAFVPMSQRFGKRFMSLTVETPPLGDSVLEGDVSEWKKNVGDWVNEDDVLVVLETAKVGVDIPAPQAGILKAQFLKVGDVAKVGDKLCEIDTDAPKPAGAAATPAPAAAAAPTPAAAPAAAAPAAAPKAAPTPAAPAATKAVTPETAATTGFVREDRKVLLSPMHLAAVARMKEGQNTMALLTTFNEVNMSAAQDMRNLYAKPFEKKFGTPMSYLSLFVAAASAGIKEFPAVNYSIDGVHTVERDYQDIAVSVPTAHGLVNPVIRNAHNKNFTQFEKELATYGQQARSNSLALEDLAGGTFTINNGGVYGALYGTSLVNGPQACALNLHMIKDRPIAVGKEAKLAPMMYISLSYDHRLIDGATAVQFLKFVKDSVEDPRRLVIQL